MVENIVILTEDIMNTKHTPGPWKWETWNEGKALCHKGLRLFGVLVDSRKDWPGAKDALLIQAAPDLLAACELALHCATVPGGDIKARAKECIDMLEAAIAKATGQ